MKVSGRVREEPQGPLPRRRDGRGVRAGLVLALRHQAEPPRPRGAIRSSPLIADFKMFEPPMSRGVIDAEVARGSASAIRKANAARRGARHGGAADVSE